MRIIEINHTALRSFAEQDYSFSKPVIVDKIFLLIKVDVIMHKVFKSTFLSFMKLCHFERFLSRISLQLDGL